MQYSFSVVVFDPNDPTTLETTAEVLREYQSVVIDCTSQDALWTAIEHQSVDVAVLDLNKPFDQSFRLLAAIQTKSPQTEVIFVAHFDDEILCAWMEVIQRGAYEFLPKPFDPEELKHHIVHAAEKHHPLEFRNPVPEHLVGSFSLVTRSSAKGA